MVINVRINCQTPKICSFKVTHQRDLCFISRSVGNSYPMIIITFVTLLIILSIVLVKAALYTSLCDLSHVCGTLVNES